MEKNTNYRLPVDKLLAESEQASNVKVHKDVENSTFPVGDRDIPFRDYYVHRMGADVTDEDVLGIIKEFAKKLDEVILESGTDVVALGQFRMYYSPPAFWDPVRYIPCEPTEPYWTAVLSFAVDNNADPVTP